MKYLVDTESSIPSYISNYISSNKLIKLTQFACKPSNEDTYGNRYHFFVSLFKVGSLNWTQDSSSISFNPLLSFRVFWILNSFIGEPFLRGGPAFRSLKNSEDPLWIVNRRSWLLLCRELWDFAALPNQSLFQDLIHIHNQILIPQYSDSFISSIFIHCWIFQTMREHTSIKLLTKRLLHITFQGEHRSGCLAWNLYLLTSLHTNYKSVRKLE